MHFVYIVTYLGKILVIEWEISSLINDYFVVCIEKNVTNNINNETIIQQFQIWKTHRRKLQKEIIKLYIFEIFLC